MNVTIDIVVSCAWFQKRLSWMMSSVLQQQGNIPDITFSVAYPKNNGNPTTESVCNLFKSNGLKIRETVYDTESDMQRRGIVRNKQLKDTDCEWILFADTDMLYSPLFFADLKKQLLTNLKNEKKVISANRVSLDKAFSKNYFNNTDPHEYPCIIQNPHEIVKDWPVFKISKNCGAGYFQLVNTQSIMEKGGIYVDPCKCRDYPTVDKFQKAKSDQQFRRMMGGITKIKTMPQYHLNHERDNEEGKHLTIQR
jgi:hypothetical protein